MIDIAPSVGPYSIKVLDKGFVTLEDFMGGDLRVVNAAKVSNKKRSEKMGEGEEKLIKYLMKHKHTSPFEHSMFTFYTKAPIFVLREWHRHRTWKFNEASGRYIVFDPEYYIPDKIRTPAATNKQGSIFPSEEFLEEWQNQHPFKIDIIDGVPSRGTYNETHRTNIRKASDQAYAWYMHMINDGVAKEIARTVLPLNMYTEMFATIDAHNLMKFLQLRTSSDAQWEIQEYARALEEMFKCKMPITYKLWKEYGI